MSFEFRDGIWISSNQKDISYPDSASEKLVELEDLSYWFNFRNEFICSVIGKFSLRKTNVTGTFIDIGGGNGFVSRAIQNLGFETTLVEPGKGAFNAHRRGLRNVYYGTFQELEKDHQFDNAGLFDVIEHIENPVDFLNDLKAYLKPGGVLYLAVPTYMFLWSTEDDFAGHYRRYTKSSLQTELNEAGFEIAYSTYFFSFLILPILLLRVLPERLAKFMGLKVAKSGEIGKGLVVGKLATRLLRFAFNIEKKIISIFGTMPFGASLLVVARKRD